MSEKTTKQTITDFNVSWSADHEQYWQGHGIAFTDYVHCATGCGESLREAFEDALEDLAQQDIEISADIEKAMLEELEAQCSGEFKEPLDVSIVDACCDASGEHRTTIDCDDCEGTGDNPNDDTGITPCSTCEGKGQFEGEDESPDCAVCAGDWHFYVSIDVKVEGKGE